jgi:hypothetical protein
MNNQKNQVVLITPPDLSFQYAKNILAVDLDAEQQRALLTVTLDSLDGAAIWAWSSQAQQDENWLLNASKLADVIVINAGPQCALATYLVSQTKCRWLKSSSISHDLLISLNTRSLNAISDLDL